MPALGQHGPPRATDRHLPPACPNPSRPLQSGCGRGDVDGDFVTPLCISQLPGAESLLLPGVWHIPRRKAGQLWYGDAPVQLEWLPYLHPADSPRPKAAASEAAL